MLRPSAASALAALVAAGLLAGCLDRDAFPSCSGDTWPSWSPGEARVTVCVDGDARRALLYVPIGAAEREDVPLLLMLHGATGNADQLRRGSGMDAVADESGFAVLYADGTPSRQRESAKTWNALLCCARAYDLQVDDVGFLGRLLDGAMEHYPVDPARIGVAGHSNGAMMAYRLAAERSDVVASAMAVAGTIGGQLSPSTPKVVLPAPAEPLSILSLHAVDDEFVPYDGGHGLFTVDGPRIDLSVNATLAFWRAAAGIEGEAATTEQGSIVRMVWGPGERGTVVEHIRTSGGHGWPGSPEKPLRSPAEPDASREIGRFLLAHPRQAAAA